MEITQINWQTDSLGVIRAKQELSGFLQEQSECEKGKYPKIDAYHERRISELTDYILQNTQADMVAARVTNVIIENQGHKWEFENMTLQQGIQKAVSISGFLGLIGRVYVSCSDGSNTWFWS